MASSDEANIKRQEKTRKELQSFLKLASKNEKKVGKSLDTNSRGALTAKGRRALKKKGPQTREQGKELEGEEIESIASAVGGSIRGAAEGLVDKTVDKITPGVLKPARDFLRLRGDQKKTKKALATQRKKFKEKVEDGNQKYPGAGKKLFDSFLRNYKGDPADAYEAFIDTLIKAENVTGDSYESLLESINGGADDPDVLDAALKDSMQDAGVDTQGKGLGGLRFGGQDISPPKSDGGGGGAGSAGSAGGGGGGESQVEAKLETMIQVLGFINNDVSKIASGAPTKLDKKEQKLEASREDSSVATITEVIGSGEGESGGGLLGSLAGMAGSITSLIAGAGGLGGILATIGPAALLAAKGLAVIAAAAVTAYAAYKAGGLLNETGNDISEALGFDEGEFDDMLINMVTPFGNIPFVGDFIQESLGLGDVSEQAKREREGGLMKGAIDPAEIAGPLTGDDSKEAKIAKYVLPSLRASSFIPEMLEHRALANPAVAQKVLALNAFNKENGGISVPEKKIKDFIGQAEGAGPVDIASIEASGDNLTSITPSATTAVQTTATIDASTASNAATSTGGGGGGGAAIVDASSRSSSTTTNNHLHTSGVGQTESSMRASQFKNGTANATQRV